MDAAAGIFTWLDRAKLPQYYFLLRDKGCATIHAALFVDDRDLLSVGVEDPSHQTRLLRALSVVCTYVWGAAFRAVL